jgi:hypothetical protein
VSGASGLAGDMLYRELQEADWLPATTRLTGKALAVRIHLYPGKALGGVSSLAAAIEKRTGRRVSERAVHYAVQLLKRHGFVSVRCCGGNACVGGRHHACQFTVGPRTFRGGWRRAGRFFVREKGAKTFGASREMYISLDSESKVEPSARPLRSSGAVDKPPPREAADARGPTRIGDLIAQLQPGGAAPAFGP